MPVKFTLMLFQFLLIIFVLATRVREMGSFNTYYRKNMFIKESLLATAKNLLSTRQETDLC